MSILDAHPEARPGAYWPPGFRERAAEQAKRIAEADRQRARCSCQCHQPPTAGAPVTILKAALAALASVVLTALLLVALVGCAPTFACKSDVQVELTNKAVVVKCLDGSAPTVTVTASKVVGP